MSLLRQCSPEGEFAGDADGLALGLPEGDALGEDDGDGAGLGDGLAEPVGILPLAENTAWQNGGGISVLS